MRLIADSYVSYLSDQVGVEVFVSVAISSKGYGPVSSFVRRAELYALEMGWILQELVVH